MVYIELGEPKHGVFTVKRSTLGNYTIFVCIYMFSLNGKIKIEIISMWKGFVNLMVNNVSEQAQIT